MDREASIARERSPAVAACRVSRVPTKFYVTCKCARCECGRVTCLFLSVSLAVSFYCRSGTYETSFGVDQRLSRSLYRDTADKFFFSSPARTSPSPSSEILSRCRQSGSLFLSRVSVKSPASIPYGEKKRVMEAAGFESSFTNFVTRIEGTRCRLALHLYSLRKVRSRPRSLNSIICGISS